MAKIILVRKTSTTFTVQIDELGYPQNQYGGFQFRLTGGPWVPIESKTDDTGTKSPEITIIGRTPATSYVVEGQALFNNTWWDVDSLTVSTDGLSKPVIVNAYATNAGEIYVDWGAVEGATSYEVQLVSSSGTTERTTSNLYSYVGSLTANTSYSVSVRAKAGTNTFSIYSDTKTVTTPLARPTNFAWFTAKVSGEAFNLTASEWNTFTARINAFRTYKLLSTYAFTSAVTGNSLTAVMYNEARNAINAMSPTTAIPSYRSSGDVIYASDLNTLVSSLNSIT